MKVDGRSREVDVGRVSMVGAKNTLGNPCG